MRGPRRRSTHLPLEGRGLGDAPRSCLTSGDANLELSDILQRTPTGDRRGSGLVENVALVQLKAARSPVMHDRTPAARALDVLHLAA